MKSLYLALMALAALLCGSCGGKTDKMMPYKWSRLSPVLDSLTIRLENGFYEDLPADTLAALVSGYETAATAAHDSVALTRGLYWRARLLKRGGDIDSALNVASEALAIVDSVENTYDFFRLRGLVRQYSHSVGAEPYRDIDEEARFYTAIGDRPMTAAMYISLGSTLFNIGDYDKSLQYMEEANDINNSLGLTKLVEKNNINIANIHHRKGDLKKCLSMLRELAESPVIQADSGAYNLALRNLYVFTGDIHYLYRAYSAVDGNSNRRDLQGLYQALLSEHYNDLGIADSAASYSRLAIRNLDQTDNFAHKCMIAQVYAETMERDKDTSLDEAIRALGN